MEEIGFTTRCLHKSGLPLNEIIDFYRSTEATAIELSFGSPGELKNFNLNSPLIKKISEFKYISIHAPFLNFKYSKNSQTKEVLEKLTYLKENLPVQGVVIHPSNIQDFSIIQDSDLPFLIENMDPRKSRGKYPLEFKEYNKLNVGYVLDIQHAYENDPSMKLAKELIKIMGEKLKHLHVSGEQNSSNHFPVHLSRNCHEVQEISKLCLTTPVILEGRISEPNLEIASKELNFILSK